MRVSKLLTSRSTLPFTELRAARLARECHREVYELLESMRVHTDIR